MEKGEKRERRRRGKRRESNFIGKRGEKRRKGGEDLERSKTRG